MFWKKKCDHRYAEVARFYSVVNRGSGEYSLKAYTVHECVKCGYIQKDQIYSKNFYQGTYQNLKSMEEEIQVLKGAKFISEIEFVTIMADKGIHYTR